MIHCKHPQWRGPQTYMFDTELDEWEKYKHFFRHEKQLILIDSHTLLHYKKNEYYTNYWNN